MNRYEANQRTDYGETVLYGPLPQGMIGLIHISDMQKSGVRFFSRAAREANKKYEQTQGRMRPVKGIEEEYNPDEPRSGALGDFSIHNYDSTSLGDRIQKSKDERK